MNRRIFMKACLALAAQTAIPVEVVAQAFKAPAPAAVNYSDLLVAVYLSKLLETDPRHGQCIIARGDEHILHLGVAPYSYASWRAHDWPIVQTPDLKMTVSEGVVGELVFDSGRVVFVSDTETIEGWWKKPA